MTDDDSDRSKQASAEHDAKMIALFHSERSLSDAQRTGIATTSLMTVGLTLGVALTTMNGGVLCCAFVAWSGIALPMGVISGGLAHRIFYETFVPVQRMAIVFALIGMLSIFGWILLLGLAGARM
jgi:hypothetical protein